MKKFALLATLLLMMGVMFSSCNKQVEEDVNFDHAQLRAGTWTVDKVDVNYFDFAGNLTNTETTLFGEGEEGGICTFHYTESKWQMDDNGTDYESGYRLDGRVIYTDDGSQWGIRQLSDTQLEMVLRGSESTNPCDYNVNGSVYYLSRSTR